MKELELWFGSTPVARLEDEFGRAWVLISDLKVALGLSSSDTDGSGPGRGRHRARRGTDPSRMAAWVTEVDPSWTRQATAEESTSFRKRSARRGSGGGASPYLVTREGAFVILNRVRSVDSKLVHEFQRWVNGTLLPAADDAGQLGAPEVTIVPTTPSTDVVVPSSPLEALRAVVDQMIIQEQRVAALEQDQATTRDAVSEVAARLDAQEGRHDYFAALGWAKLTGFQPQDDVTLARLGRIAVSVGAANGVERGTTQHAHYGAVNTWPRWVWEEAARLWRERA